MVPTKPANGGVDCEEGDTGVRCKLSCKKGFAFANPPAKEYVCSYKKGTWLPKDNFPFPDCAGMFIRCY